MKTKVLGINEAAATNKPVLYTCYGLGSCVGLFLTDRLKKVSGGAHIPLPASSAENIFRDAESMIDELLHKLQTLGGNIHYLRAKVTGGANVLPGNLTIGEQNVQVVLHHLITHNIFIAAADVGGHEARTARFNSVSGELTISKPNQKMYFI
jgi:chemotaxis protein CheD